MTAEAATHPASAADGRRSVALVTLGCTRNEVDSEELAGRLLAQGWDLVQDAAEADVALVNTCGFIEQAKKDSIDALLEACDLRDGTGRTRAVVAVGCLAERYGEQLASQLPEADAVLGFDSYAGLSGHLSTILAGGHVPSHAPADRRRLLPLSPAARQGSAAAARTPGHAGPGPGGSGDGATGDGATGRGPDDTRGAPASGPRVVRARLGAAPWAPLKIASGCDRRCAFCAIPSFRGAYLSRPPDDVVAEARWLAARGVRELYLVSENSTSYGKDLGDLLLLERLLPRLAAVEGIERVRVSYLQPAEVRPSLLEAMAATPGVAPYFDISFQHACAPLLRRMRRFGGTDAFLDLLARVRDRQPDAGIRSNVIVGFPGETEQDVAELERFLVAARLDVVGVFGYSDEDGTEAQGYGDKVPQGSIDERVERLGMLVEELTAERARERVGQVVDVLVEDVDGVDEDDEVDGVDGGVGSVVGRTGFQGPEVDGTTRLLPPRYGDRPAVGDLVRAVVVDSVGVDLVARVREPDERW